MGRAILSSEISGSIWKINCKVGDVVESGQDVIVIESMKMEIPVFQMFLARLSLFL